MTQYRAHFDAHIEFANGGDLTARDFRLDLPSADADVSQLLVQHLEWMPVGDGADARYGLRATRLEMLERMEQ